MRMRFKSMLSFIFLLIICCTAIGIGYLFYDKVTNDSDIVIDGNITINYLNGKSFKLSGDNELSFSVTNNDTETKYYYIQLSDVSAKDVSYELVSSDNLKITNELKSEIISNQVSINGENTINYTIKFITKDNEEYSGTINIGAKENETNTFSDVLLNNNKVSEVSLTNNGEIATLDEGLLKTVDDLGVAYYFRGKVSNNNVSFAGFNWKIVKINGDGSIKLVLDNIIEDVTKYYEENYEFENSTINIVLNAWYDNNLESFSDYIAYYKYCNDITLEDSENFLGFNRVITNKIPNYICLGTKYNTKIGLLTVDEVSMAGAGTEENKSFYLYNEKIERDSYLMSGAKLNKNVYYPFILTSKGNIVYNVEGKLLRGVRPVINIIKTAKVTGNGTIDEPYKIVMN